MSTFGTTGYAAQIASSTSRTHRGDADRARTAEAGERSRFEAAKQGVDAADDIAKAELSADRDPDGREFREPPPPPREEDATPAEPRPRIIDSLDDIGEHLDLEA
jgi:hypothetical protein